jgi:hypothetical protein
MQNKRDVISSVVLILIGLAVIVWSIRLQVGTLLRPIPRFFPFLVGFGIIALSLILLVQGWLGRLLMAVYLSEDKTLSVFTAEEGGAQHCQRDYLTLGIAEMWNWFEDKLVYGR